MQASYQDRMKLGREDLSKHINRPWLDKAAERNHGLDSNLNKRPSSASSVDLGACEETDELLLVKSVLALSKLYGLASWDHPWFALSNSFPPSSIRVTRIEHGDLKSSQYSMRIMMVCSDVEGEGINITEMISLLNIANNDEPVVDALKEQLSTQFLLSRSYLVFRGVQ
ncbi:hypothetical protein PSTT_04815, partial [Puccinia striiformis]